MRVGIIFSLNAPLLREYLVSKALASWEDLIDRGCSTLKGKGMRSTVSKIALWAVVYHIWLQRKVLGWVLKLN